MDFAGIAPAAQPRRIERFPYSMNTPSPLDPDQSTADGDYLRVLAIFHFVVAGLLLPLVGLIVFETIRTIIVIFEVRGDFAPTPLPPPIPAMTVLLFFLMALAVLTVIGNLLSGLYIRRRKNRVFSLVMAGFNCLQVPLGTALGVSTFVILMRDSVRRIYREAETP
jgi:hypothetical protein